MPTEQLQNYALSTDMATQIELNAFSSELVDGLSSVNSRLSAIADLIYSEVQRLDTLSSDLSGIGSGSMSSSDYVPLSTYNADMGMLSAILDQINGESI